MSPGNPQAVVKGVGAPLMESSGCFGSAQATRGGGPPEQVVPDEVLVSGGKVHPPTEEPSSLARRPESQRIVCSRELERVEETLLGEVNG
mmetsp:Transcript_82135/g.266173  ORF Transcript_82135/g.266173 Transcript_82135/m.266173 type:complete len:90 (-) Transcript_82135:673-942(-)